MRAAVCTRYGGPDVIQLQDVPMPTPKNREVLVRVRATTVASGDHRVRAFDMPKGFRAVGRLALGFRGPRQPILGTDLAGDVFAVGRRVTLFQPGDPVMVASSATHAEYARVPEDGGIVKKPPNLNYEEAASMVFGGVTAVCYLRDLAQVRPAHRIVVYGASGAVGTASVQLAKHLGAHVAGVCSGANTRLVQSLGADEVFDYAKQSFPPGGRTYDAIFDTVGKTTYKQCKAALSKGGAYLPAVASPLQMVRAALFRHGRVRAAVAAATQERMLFLAGLAAAGAMKPVIDRSYPLDEIVEAHRYVDTGRKRGSVVVRVA